MEENNNPTILLTIPAPDAIHPLTRAAQSTDPRTATWLSGQLWAWDGGEAVTVVTGNYGDPVYFVVREGERVTVEEGRSINAVLGARGYRVQLHPDF